MAEQETRQHWWDFKRAGTTAAAYCNRCGKTVRLSSRASKKNLRDWIAEVADETCSGPPRLSDEERTQTMAQIRERWERSARRTPWITARRELRALFEGIDSQSARYQLYGEHLEPEERDDWEEFAQEFAEVRESVAQLLVTAVERLGPDSIMWVDGEPGRRDVAFWREMEKRGVQLSSDFFAKPRRKCSNVDPHRDEDES